MVRLSEVLPFHQEVDRDLRLPNGVGRGRIWLVCEAMPGAVLPDQDIERITKFFVVDPDLARKESCSPVPAMDCVLQ